MKTANQIREEFINFFASKEHTVVQAAPVVPFDDPTLLFTVAGMTQFKDVFLGTGKRDYTRAVDSQKCIRAGGKHNDLDDVGKDGYHHSFFEMLGNWSFGDYYKKEAIGWAWELLTKVWGLPKDKLYATVYTTDDDAENFWKSETDIDHSHISRHGDKDNFWMMGETGPCGPCTEIHFDRGPAFCDKQGVPGHVCEANGDCPRVMEIWNLVFIQYNKDENGVLHELPNKHVDTGMGFERICSVMQQADSNYHIDLFKEIIKGIETVTGTAYQTDDRGIPFRVIADHIRTLLFSISDGAIPSNEGRGYVLRRILRRASRFGTKIGMNEPFLYKIVPFVVDVMGDSYPEIVKYAKHAQNVIKAEEASFLRTLNRGIELFNEIAETMQKANQSVVDGVTLFKLYDTFGFPVDLTAQMAEEKGYTIDEAGFKVEMEKQKEQSQKNKKFKTETITEWIELAELTKSEFIGYTENGGESTIAKYNLTGDLLKIIPVKSYFYAESGGQVSDSGTITIAGQNFPVTAVEKDGEYIVISAKIAGALPPLDENTVVEQQVNTELRQGCRIHHSATHLLQAAMRKTLGEHVAQSGSFVTSEILRFDYSHFEKLTSEQIQNIENDVNSFIRADYPVVTEVLPIEEAKKRNVMALFGEKYGDTVRVVTMGGVSAELCGGTHAQTTGSIGYFKILSETSIAAGIRRIEAVCGAKAVEVSRKHQLINEQIRETLVCKEDEILERFAKLGTDKRELEKKIVQLQEQLAAGEVNQLLEQAKMINGIKTVSAIVECAEASILKSMGETLRNRLGSGIGLLGADIDGKASLICVVTDDLKNTYKAGAIVGTAAKLVGGGGGGAPHIATAGGKDVAGLAAAVGVLADVIK